MLTMMAESDLRGDTKGALGFLPTSLPPVELTAGLEVKLPPETVIVTVSGGWLRLEQC
jgi:hypothetical protein